MKDKSAFITLLRYIGYCLPSDWLKTTFYLYLIHYPRKLFRNLLFNFYRMEHIYDVFKEFSSQYKGEFSVLEFGVADGYSFTKKLYAARYLKIDERMHFHGFDTFEGMPESTDKRDLDWVADDHWIEGQYKGRLEELQSYCESRYKNVEFHKGLFDSTVTDTFFKKLENKPPILIWIDCDYYTATKAALQPLLPHIPTGCVIYFDEYYWNFYSTLTGEARFVAELNRGEYGEGYELVLDTALSLDSRRIYRFINQNSELRFEKKEMSFQASDVRQRSNDSPLP